MTGEDAYRWLMDASRIASADPFDVHVVASILALAIAEVGMGKSLGDGAGLSAPELGVLAMMLFPPAADDLGALSGMEAPVIDTEEQSLRDILLMYASGPDGLIKPLAFLIARRCSFPNHLWQDLGLRNRGELSRLMQTHFAGLSRRNSGDMKWKKFLYRMVCSTEGFTLCTAPVCSECADFEVCFGAEDGDALLARLRNGKMVPA